MIVETHVQQALDRVQEEQVAIDGKQTAYERFVSGVETISTDPPTTQRDGLQTTTDPVATRRSTPSGRSGSRKQVRKLFVETVRPHSTADIDEPETLLETIAAELSDQLAVALAPQNTTTNFTAGLKNGLLFEAAQLRRELRVMERALNREETSLVEAKDTIDEVLQWIIEANETRLTDLGFEALRARHDRLDEFHDQCSTTAHERQSVLHTTTNVDGQARIDHQQLVRCLYVSFPVEYPVLSTIVRVEEVCDECQRAIRSHLVRRV